MSNQIDTERLWIAEGAQIPARSPRSTALRKFEQVITQGGLVLDGVSRIHRDDEDGYFLEVSVFVPFEDSESSSLESSSR